MADNKADKAGPKPAADFPQDDTKAKAETTVAREKQDARADADSVSADNAANADVLDPSKHGALNATSTAAQLEKARLTDEAEAEQKAIEELGPVKVYNPNAGLTPRVGGPYLDQLELERAEVQRAVFENRKPNFKDMAGTAGVPLMTAGQVANLHGGSPALAQFIEAHENDDKLGPIPVTEVPLVGTNLDVIKVGKAETEARKNFDNTTVTSHDNPDVVFTEGHTRDAAR